LRRPPRKLTDEWADRLTAAGFRDIEVAANRDGQLKTDVRTDAKSVMAREGDERAHYYRMARTFLHDYRFPSARDRRIWALHAEGRSIDRIMGDLRLPHFQVQSAIERTRAAMLAPRSKRGRKPAGPTGYGDQQYRRRIRFSDVETEAIHFIAVYSQVSAIDAVRLAVLAYARAVRISGAGNCRMPVPDEGDTNDK
jgi:hypothetical protein